ncbi:Glyoxalase-like domain protein [Planctomycetes bacterium CA13]|uniref:Glyoxalase-like domain protein n=1 Tax=Novipirellula herctigrandis TaxID=2527986 RepID=A0A5C5YN72_9BACT|nr:Glyoxalase-like domain protein [Planctomycetes bacterium CA13]
MYIEHVAIWTKDIERLRAFYEMYFEVQTGEKYVNPKRGFEFYFLQFVSGPRLELMSLSTIPQTRDNIDWQFTGIIHLAFSVGSEPQVDQLTERLDRDSYRTVDGPRHTGDGCYKNVVFAPDGNRIEITT